MWERGMREEENGSDEDGWEVKGELGNRKYAFFLERIKTAYTSKARKKRQNS